LHLSATGSELLLHKLSIKPSCLGERTGSGNGPGRCERGVNIGCGVLKALSFHLARSLIVGVHNAFPLVRALLRGRAQIGKGPVYPQGLHKVPESKACGRTSGPALAEPLAFEGPAANLAAPLLFGRMN
jgi:hypothetical protein